MESNLLFHQYLNLYEKHNQQYGKIALLMQVGSFYELYTTLDCTKGNAKQVADVLEMECNPKKDNRSRMAGFPIHAFAKHLPRLLREGYTVVCYDQENNIKDPIKKQVNRFLARVISPSTNLDNPETTSWTVSIFMEFNPHPFKQNAPLCSFGAAAVDRTVSQKVTIFEAHDTHQDTHVAYDKLVSFLERYPPTECVITTDKPQLAQRLIDKALGPMECIIHITPWDPSQPHDQAHELLSFHHNEAYHALYNFLQDHFLTLQYPIIESFKSTSHLELSGTATEQLDIPLLINTLNKTRTKMGNRLFKERILSPLTDATEINKRLDIVEKVTMNQLQLTRDILSGMPDLSRLHQRWCLKRLSPSQLKLCLNTYEKAITHMDPLFPIEFKSNLVKLCGECKSIFNLDNLDQDDMTLPIFNQGQQKSIDTLFKKLNVQYKSIQESKLELEKCVGKPDTVKVNTSQRGFETTQIRSKTIKQTFKTLTYRSTKNAVIISSDTITKTFDEIDDLKQAIESQQEYIFRQILEDISKNYEKVQQQIECYIANTDVVTTSKYIAHTYRYTRPIIVTDERILDAKTLRHAIIERLHEHYEYIPCDITLSEGGKTGYVMYGMNAGGKTSTLKAIGLAVILAQAGLYVPASHLKLSPFKQVMTRIAGGDNMIRGQSSFQVEMEELRSVLHRADQETLLLGDEVCRGTEVNSANAIVYTLFRHLNEHEIFFMAATHLHELAEPIENNLNGIRVCHTTVDILPDGTIVYKRQLEDGAGPSMYGLEVARALDFPPTFLKYAKEFRDTESTQQSKKSRYNTKKVVTKCQVCNATPKNKEIPLDTHHLNFQCNADKDGFHNHHHHKHALYNLVVLCKPCHQQVHVGNLVLEMIQTPKGSKLNYLWKNLSSLLEEDSDVQDVLIH